VKPFSFFMTFVSFWFLFCLCLIFYFIAYTLCLLAIRVPVLNKRHDYFYSLIYLMIYLYIAMFCHDRYLYKYDGEPRGFRPVSAEIQRRARENQHRAGARASRPLALTRIFHKCNAFPGYGDLLHAFFYKMRASYLLPAYPTL